MRAISWAHDHTTRPDAGANRLTSKEHQPSGARLRACVGPDHTTRPDAGANRLTSKEHQPSGASLRACVCTIAFVLSAALAANVMAQSTTPQPVFKPLPPPGIQIDPGQRTGLEQRLESVRQQLNRTVAESNDGSGWQSDVDVLIRAVHLALEQDLFFKDGEVEAAERLLDEAARRITAASAGTRGLELLGFNPDANDHPQPLVAGFVSHIDDSVQPYGIVVPAGFTIPQAETPLRMDVWLHGRGDTKTEIPFLTERMTKAGHYTPEGTIVLHPFGRHCNAFKFAGETDVYEAIDDIQSRIAIDPNRVSIRGFSMGGAGCWHLAVHDPYRWLAANPGAGFVDTLRYQGWTQTTPFPLTATTEKLLRWYDVLPWTQNLKGTRTIAYSGEVDKQKMAADRVAARAEELGFQFPYVIGAGMGHKIDDLSKQQIDAQIAKWAAEADQGPETEIDFVTYTLRYSQAGWLRISGMQEHWTAASVSARLDRENESLRIETDGVTHLEIDFSATGWPGRRGAVDIEIDGQRYSVDDTGNLRGFQCTLAKDASSEWTSTRDDEMTLRKRPGLQGPIDDAFCDRFVIVMPSRPARHGQVQRWIDREAEYLKQRWSRLMRGDVQVVLDRDLTDDHLETCHLICFGDFSGNRFLFNIADRLPIQWTRETLRVGDQSFDPVHHAPVFCYPNPLNPRRYIVVNSGMTFREFSNVSNSRQIAMLPDWAVLDVESDDDSIYAGEIMGQGFFDEAWRLK